MKAFKLVLIALIASTAQAALAHTELSGSEPANHAMLQSAPENVMLHFSQSVRLTALTVQKEGEAKRSLGPLPADASEHFLVAAPGLSDGHYTVSWRALSEDTHVMTGDLMFMVGAAGEHAQVTGHAEAGHVDHAGHSAEAGAEAEAQTSDHADHTGH